MTFKRKRAAERYAVIRSCVAQERALIWDIVTDAQGSWHRYQRSQLEVYDTVEHRRAFRSAVVFALRRFGEEVEGLLLYLAVEFDRVPTLLPPPARGLVDEMSVYVQHVRPRVVPAGLRHTLARYLELRLRRPEDLADDELRVLAVGLCGVWDKLEDGLREFERWLVQMSGE
jgi:hypothetical protein